MHHRRDRAVTQLTPFKAISSVTMLVLGIMTCGCAPKSADSDALLGLAAGMSPVEVQKRIGSAHMHQFTALIDGEEILGVSQNFRDPYMRIYLIYRNHALAKIVDVPPESMFRVDHPTDTNWTDRIPVNPEQRMQAV